MFKTSKIILGNHIELSINNEIDTMISKASILKQNTLKNFNDEKIHKNLKINSLVPLKPPETKFLKQNLKTPSITIVLNSNILYYKGIYFLYHLSQKALFGAIKVLARTINFSIKSKFIEKKSTEGNA
ncbi:hypothetical protein [Borrelia sp. RT1S]|uniref:hypothetical protein n=1 Tax=Borrelia sp. RT1S TaxID=2898580 RepID=UPI001E282A13|nr:hypothetical protein [Borrelia sp. RT1S]UGQ17532.1 hypothetical protein LSO05_03945 [Borrelia sp. RT1S]